MTMARYEGDLRPCCIQQVVWRILNSINPVEDAICERESNEFLWPDAKDRVWPVEAEIKLKNLRERIKRERAVLAR